MIKSIIPECYIDTCLINVLLRTDVGNKGVNHGKGNSATAKKMQEKFYNSFSLGIIDKDKRQIDYLNEFVVINKTIKDFSLLYKHKEKHHYFIQLCPESENWICNVSEEIGINLTNQYELPNSPTLLAEYTKDVDSKTDPKFIRLFKDIVRQSEEINFEPVLKLKHWLRILVDDNYHVDINELEK
jgi:hypothetical protein